MNHETTQPREGAAPWPLWRWLIVSTVVVLFGVLAWTYGARQAYNSADFPDVSTVAGPCGPGGFVGHDHSQYSPGPAASPSQSPDACHEHGGGPVDSDFVDILAVGPNTPTVQPGPDASTGSFVSECGRNENNHLNPDNFIVAPGVLNGAHHTHDYVGNVSTDASSTNDSLAAAGTTCRLGDRSAYFWPVLRNPAGGAGADGNDGDILRPVSVQLEFLGNALAKVVPMPRFLRVITGDAKADTNGPANARAQWTCRGFDNRVTTKYPLCRDGGVRRILEFPSCWNGKDIDSANHRTHVVFPANNGQCPKGTLAIPRLRMTLTYLAPLGRSFAVDSFPEQKHNPLTDHADFANVMSEQLMALVVECINTGELASGRA
jgi:hypothetical protein